MENRKFIKKQKLTKDVSGWVCVYDFVYTCLYALGKPIFFFFNALKQILMIFENKQRIILHSYLGLI